MTTKKSKAGAAPKRASKKKSKPMGRPSIFDEKMANHILELASKGRVNSEICQEVGIALSTLYSWLSQYPDFSDAMSKTKDAVDDLVEAALFKRATGYEHEAIKIFCNEGRITTKAYTERYPPDTAALSFWLRNRRRHKWQDVQRRELTGPDGEPIKTEGGPQIIVTLPSNGREAKEE